MRAQEIRTRLKDFHLQPERLQADRLQPERPDTVLSCSIGVAAFDETTDRVDLLLKFCR